jgi:long-chain fatty acid transport protein
MLLRRATRSLLWSTAALLLPGFAGAQGFALNEIGTCAISRGFAVTAGGCKDASLIFWNPAATVRLDNWSILTGATAISLKGAYTRDTTRRRFETDIPTAIVPHIFINKQVTFMSRKLSLGGGVYVPYGLTSQWTDDFPGRFASKKAALSTIYVQPNLAYQISDRWSIGGGPIYAKSHVELIQSIDLAALPAAGTITFAQLGFAKGTEIGQVHVEGGGHSFGATIGLMGKLTDRWTMGARYLSKVRVKYRGADAEFTPTVTGLVVPASIPGIPAGTSVDALVAPQFASGGNFAPQQASTEITHPDQAQLGFNYSGFKDWNVEIDYQWTGWKKFKNVPVGFTVPALNRTLIEDYNNTSAFRLGAERAFANKAQLRLGAAGATTAAPDATVTPLLPEQERGYLSIGGAYPFMERFTVDGAYMQIITPGRRGRTDERPSRTIGANALNNGVYSLSAYIISLSLKASF